MFKKNLVAPIITTHRLKIFLILSTSTGLPSQILNFWCCNFLNVTEFCILEYLQAVSKHSFELRDPLQLICFTCRSNFDWSCYLTKERKKKSKLSSEIQSLYGKHSLSKAWGRFFFKLCGLFRKPQLYEQYETLFSTVHCP